MHVIGPTASGHAGYLDQWWLVGPRSGEAHESCKAQVRHVLARLHTSSLADEKRAQSGRFQEAKALPHQADGIHIFWRAAW